MSEQPPAETGEPTAYDAMGGHDTFVALVTHFYDGVAADPVLRPMYPEADLGPARERLQLFLEQYWGGPTTYSDRRGHPRLRMRHASFPVTAQARDHWLAHMASAMDQVHIEQPWRDQLWRYLELAAHAMVNQDDEPPPRSVLHGT
jgi:hemoglobin